MAFFRWGGPSTRQQQLYLEVRGITYEVGSWSPFVFAEYYEVKWGRARVHRFCYLSWCFVALWPYEATATASVYIDHN